MLGVVVLAIVALALGWLVVTGLLARHELQVARAQVGALRADVLAHRVGSARSRLAAVRRDAEAARGETHDPLWSAAADVPLLGDPARVVRGATLAVDRLAREVLPTVIDVGGALDPHALRVSADEINVVPLQHAAAPLAAVARVTDAVQRQLDALPRSGWFPPVADARSALQRDVEGLAATLTDAVVAARIMPPMLGADGPRRYMLVFENDAESRGTGGLPGAFAILEADHGRLRFTHFGNDTELGGLPTEPMAGSVFGPTNIFVNTNMSLHFPFAARAWVDMWQAKTGERLDGALATDPTALSYLLTAVGPTRLPDGTTVTAGNVVELTESAAYARFTNTSARKQFFLVIARAVASDVLHGTSAHSRDVAKALARAAGERRLLVWSRRDNEESQLADLPLSGVVPETNAPYASVVVNNAAGSKLDYYLDRWVTWRSGPCRGANQDATVAVRLRNGAPTTGLPDYVAIRADEPGSPHVRGSERLLVSLYATAGAQLAAATIDGNPLPVDVGTERRHPVYTVDVELNPQQSKELVFHLVQPRTAASPQVPMQPLVRPAHVAVSAAAC